MIFLVNREKGGRDLAHTIVIENAGVADLQQIYQLQCRVFHEEQGIPLADIPLTAAKKPQWWCAKLDQKIVGAVAVWREDGVTHWGRFLVAPAYRGRHIGSQLARESLAAIFAQGVEKVTLEARASTVKILLSLGGSVTGAEKLFYQGTITPMVIAQQSFSQGK